MTPHQWRAMKELFDQVKELYCCEMGCNSVQNSAWTSPLTITRKLSLPNETCTDSTSNDAMLLIDSMNALSSDLESLYQESTELISGTGSDADISIDVTLDTLGSTVTSPRGPDDAILGRLGDVDRRR